MSWGPEKPYGNCSKKMSPPPPISAGLNIYNENIESKQVLLLKKLNTLMESFSDILEHEIIMGGDWNFIRNKKLDADGGNPSLKLSSIAELTKIIEVYELCDIFRVRFPEKYVFPLDNQILAGYED